MKLTQSMKDAIKSKVVAEKFNPRFEAQYAAERAFANSLLDAIPRIEELDALPEGWFESSSGLYASFDGWSKCIALGVERRLPYYAANRGLRFAQGTPEYIAWKKLEHAHEVLKAEKKELESEIHRVLSAISTDKRLAEIWPEALQYLPKLPAPPPAVVTVDRLRELLK